jgi:hypothetical protein
MTGDGGDSGNYLLVGFQAEHLRHPDRQNTLADIDKHYYHGPALGDGGQHVRRADVSAAVMPDVYAPPPPGYQVGGRYRAEKIGGNN